MLLDDFGAALAEVGEGDETDSVCGEALSGIVILGGEAGRRLVGHSEQEVWVGKEVVACDRDEEKVKPVTMGVAAPPRWVSYRLVLAQGRRLQWMASAVAPVGELRTAVAGAAEHINTLQYLAWDGLLSQSTTVAWSQIISSLVDHRGLTMRETYYSNFPVFDL